jgi:small multidrug resistance pump
MVYVYLLIAIVAEVVATTSLKASESFTKLGPSLLVVAGYSVAFYLLALCLKSISVGVLYAMWSGLGIVLVAAAGAVVYKQIPDLAAVVGMALIIAGVVIMNLYSKIEVH